MLKLLLAVDINSSNLYVQMSEVKSKEERLKETLTLLRKLPEVGVPQGNPVYQHVKECMSTWVNMGPAYSERIDFGSHWGELLLPVKTGRTASLELKVKRVGRR
jgi:hypothetical protein